MADANGNVRPEREIIQTCSLAFHGMAEKYKENVTVKVESFEFDLWASITHTGCSGSKFHANQT